METRPDFVARVVAFLKNSKRLIQAVESLLIDIIAASAPWLAPLLPAWMVHIGLRDALGMPAAIAWLGAIVVEFLGLSAVSTTITLWDYNDRKRDSVRGPAKGRGRKIKPRKVRGLAPVWLTLSAGVFYMVVVLVVNVLLDDSGAVEKVAKGLLSSLSVIAALILAVRGQHARRLEAAEEQKTAMREMRNLRNQKVANRATQEALVAQPTQPEQQKSNRERILELHETQPDATKTQLAKTVGVSRQYVDRVITTTNGNGKVRPPAA